MESASKAIESDHKPKRLLKNDHLISILMSALYGVQKFDFVPEEKLQLYMNNKQYNFYESTEPFNKLLWLSGKFSARKYLIKTDAASFQKQVAYFSKYYKGISEHFFQPVAYSLTLENELLVIYKHFDYIVHSLFSNSSPPSLPSDISHDERRPTMWTKDTSCMHLIALSDACDFLHSTTPGKSDLDLRPENLIVTEEMVKVIMIPANKEGPYPCGKGPFHFPQSQGNRNTYEMKKYSTEVYQLTVLWWFLMIEKISAPPTEFESPDKFLEIMKKECCDADKLSVYHYLFKCFKNPTISFREFKNSLNSAWQGKEFDKDEVFSSLKVEKFS